MLWLLESDERDNKNGLKNLANVMNYYLSLSGGTEENKER